MSVISTSGLTLGYLTLPAASAAGLPGSCLTRNADGSGRTLPSATTLASSVRSSWAENVGTLRRYGSPPAFCAVESALAMFSEITLIRPACARRPDVAMPIERAKSPPSFAMMSFPQFRSCALALADRGLQKMQAFAVERGHGGIVHLVGGDLEHLVSSVTELPAGRVWNTALRFCSKLCPPPPACWIWEVLVRSIASEPIEPALAPLPSNFGSTRSRGLKLGVSELETFSDRTR